MTTEELTLYARDLNLQPITKVAPGDTVYVSLRYFNWEAYDQRLDLPNRFSMDYVVKVRYTKWDREDHTKIEAQVHALGDARFSFTAWFVEAWGSRQILLASMREVTSAHWLLYETMVEFVPQHLQGSFQKKVSDMRKRQRNIMNRQQR